MNVPFRTPEDYELFLRPNLPFLIREIENLINQEPG